MIVPKDELRRAGIEACMKLLVSQVRALQRAHRAGITPAYGQLENLFDTAEVLERQLERDETAADALVLCDTPQCGKLFVRKTTDGRKLCVDCAVRHIVAWLGGEKAGVGIVTPIAVALNGNGASR